MVNFNWKVNKTSKFSRARLGTIKTPHGIIQTPAFINTSDKVPIKKKSNS